GDLDAKQGAALGLEQINCATVRHDELVSDSQPESRSSLARRALEGLEQMGARFLRNTRAVVTGVYGDGCSVAQSRDANIAGPDLLLFDRLQGVTAQVAQDSEQLIAVGIDAQGVVHVDRPCNGIFAR